MWQDIGFVYSSSARVSSLPSHVSNNAAIRATDSAAKHATSSRRFTFTPKTDWSQPDKAAIMNRCYKDYTAACKAAPPGFRPRPSIFAESYGIPPKTFFKCIANGGKPPALGRSLTLIEAIEERMVNFGIFRFHFGKSLPWSYFQTLAARMASSLNDIIGPVDKLEKFKASKGWLRGFKERHSDRMTKRKIQIVSNGRAAAANPYSIRDELATRIEALEMVDKLNGGEGNADNVPASRKWNTDETGFWANTVRMDRAVEKGRKDCLNVGSDHGVKVSAALLVNADGYAAAPFYILPGIRIVKDKIDSSGHLIGVDGRSGFGFAAEGSMTDDLWESQYTDHMIREIRSINPSGYDFLSMDQYGAHINTCAALEKLLDNGIIAYSPHSNSTFFNQALDQQCIRATKSDFRRQLMEYDLEYVDPIDKWQLPGG